MREDKWLARRFEENRSHLQAVAYRMLGSLSEAEDAVQEAWLRLSRSDTHAVENLEGWLTTVVARLCLDMLRARKSRREEPLDAYESEPSHRRSQTLVGQAEGINPEQEALLADSVGLALLVVLETLAPTERLAFVLHDLFAIPFDEIAPIVGRSPAAARQLASRARRRVQGVATGPKGKKPRAADVRLAHQREIVNAFTAATRDGDFDALLALLDPEIVLRIDGGVGRRLEVHGAATVAKRAILGSTRAAQVALVNGSVGIVVAPHGRLQMALIFTISQRKIAKIDMTTDPKRLRRLNLTLLND